MSSAGAAPRAAVSVSSARAEASRRNGAKSRGPKTPEGKARSAQNALKHGLRAEKYVVLPEEDGAAFEALEAALTAELAPVGMLQTVLARRIARAAWRLDRAERLEVEVFEMRGYGGVSPGIALIRDGNGTRSIETLLRYRGAAMAELMRALRTLKALQAEQAQPVLQAAGAARVLETHPKRPRPPVPIAARPESNQPERAGEPRLEYALAEPPASGHALHQPGAPWTPKEPETPGTRHRRPPSPTSHRRNPNLTAPAAPGQATPPPAPAPSGIRATDSHGRMDPLNKCRADR